LQEFALVFALAQRACGRAAPQHSTRIYKEKFAGVVKKQRQKVQCGEKTTANFAVRVNPIRESPYVVFLQNA